MREQRMACHGGHMPRVVDMSSPRPEPSWRRPFPSETFLEEGRNFTPQWVWPLSTIAAPSASAKVLFAGGPAAQLRNETGRATAPWRTDVLIGFCERAVILLGQLQGVRCIGSGIAEPPPPSHGRLVVGAFVMHKWYQGWQHHVIDASVRFDLALPLLQAGYRVWWLHGGMLDNDMVSLRCLVPKQCALRFVEKRVEYSNFAYAYLTPESLKASRPLLPSGQPFLSPIGAEHWSPAAGEGFRAARASCLRPSAAAPNQPRVVAFLTRPWNMSRHLVNDTALAAQLRVLLAEAGIAVHVIDTGKRSNPRSLSYYAGLYGLVGVHGGAMINAHVLPTDARVLEIVDGGQAHRSFARILVAMGHVYRAYAAEYFPWSRGGVGPFFAKGPRSHVLVHSRHFVAFAHRLFTEPRRNLDASIQPQQTAHQPFRHRCRRGGAAEPCVAAPAFRAARASEGRRASRLQPPQRGAVRATAVRLRRGEGD